MIGFSWCFQYFFLSMIAIYRVTIWPIMQPVCVMQPHCSEYAKIAITRHGPWYGGYLSVRRVFSCHPWQKKLIDYVPE